MYICEGLVKESTPLLLLIICFAPTEWDTSLLVGWMAVFFLFPPTIAFGCNLALAPKSAAFLMKRSFCAFWQTKFCTTGSRACAASNKPLQVTLLTHPSALSSPANEIWDLKKGEGEK